MRALPAAPYVYPVRKQDSEIELTLDKGTVEAEGQSSPLCEIELELAERAYAILDKAASFWP
jgi:inorganic triphosphatase YgiF